MDLGKARQMRYLRQVLARAKAILAARPHLNFVLAVARVRAQVPWGGWMDGWRIAECSVVLTGRSGEAKQHGERGRERVVDAKWIMDRWRWMHGVPLPALGLYIYYDLLAAAQARKSRYSSPRLFPHRKESGSLEAKAGGIDDDAEWIERLGLQPRHKSKATDSLRLRTGAWQRATTN